MRDNIETSPGNFAQLSEDAPIEEFENKNTKQLLGSTKKYIPILGPFLVMLAVVTNSFQWSINELWTAIGCACQKCWCSIHRDWFYQNDIMFMCLGSFLVTTGYFWLVNLFFFILDSTGRPQFAKKYKIQHNVQVEWPNLLKAVKLVLFNQLAVGLPFTFCGSWLMKWRGCRVAGDLPMFHTVVFEIFIFSIIEETLFYYSHRLLHHPGLYRRIHKTHHEWTAPIGIAALYAHPLEHLMCNILPPALGPLLMGSHLATSWLWFCLALTITTVFHSGYHLPLLPSPEAHDFHHLKFNQNFGVLGVLDRLHGTDAKFRATQQYQRHFVLMSMDPVDSKYQNFQKKEGNLIGF